MNNSILRICLAAAAVCVISCTPARTAMPEEVILTYEQLQDKIKGGWAGQTIGCTYGGPTEFRYPGTMIQDYVPLYWPDGMIARYFDTGPDLYDDLYMDLTFVGVFDRLGVDALADSLAAAFASAPYYLWHANQAARNNILNGIMPPESGHWLNNPHADDIDFQIEADFIGLMNPGMPNSSSEVCDRVGHIMNYGDGWYGGVYIAAMYSLAFVSDDVEFIVNEALKVIPSESRYYKCIREVIDIHREYPCDWKTAWGMCESRWSSDIGCPEGVFTPFNIDAVINSAYVVIALLYGEGDFSRTIDIATRCGQDSDCNPASAGGILGTVLGYDGIPERWMKNLREVEDRNFAHTEISLSRAYKMSFEHALEMIGRGGGAAGDGRVAIKCQQPAKVRLEQSFEGHYPVRKFNINRSIADSAPVEFEGNGIVVMHPHIEGASGDYAAEIEVWLDGALSETVVLPANYHDRRHDLYWKYQLPQGKHSLSFIWLNPRDNIRIGLGNAVVYSDRPWSKP